jgi:uncharacterized RDD family membrane protein YckC
VQYPAPQYPAPQYPAPSYAPARVCPSCGRDFGAGMSCQFCAQVSGLPNGVRLSSAGKRFGGYLLEAVLFVVTLALGWFIWSLIVWKDGQTPAKKVLGMKVLKLQTGSTATWGNMFLREIVGKILGSIVGSITFGITTFMLLWDKNRQEIWDKIAGTIVIDDPEKQLT